MNRDAFVRPAQCLQKDCRPVQYADVLWIQLQRLSVVTGGGHVVGQVVVRVPAKACTRPRIVRGDLERLLEGRLGLGVAFVLGDDFEARQIRVSAAHPVPRRRIVRVDGKRLLVQRQGLHHALGRALATELPGAEEQRVGFGVRLPGFRFLAQQRDPEFVDHGDGDLVLDGEHVLQGPIPGLGPEVDVPVGVD
jgi:hypothetical protein